MKDAKKIELAIKALRMVSKADTFDPDNYDNYEVGDLHYGIEIALKHLTGAPTTKQEKEAMKS